MEENKLEWTDIHKKYEALLEGYLTSFCTENKITNETLYGDLAAAVEKGDRQANVLVKMIVAQVPSISPLSSFFFLRFYCPLADDDVIVKCLSFAHANRPCLFMNQLIANCPTRLTM